MSVNPFYILAQDLLKKQQILTKKMLDLLKLEYKTLNTHYADSLATITCDKQPLIIEIDTLSQQWLALLATESVEMSPEGIKLFLEDYDHVNGSDLSALWLDLRNLAKDCQKANTINGTVIALRNQSAQQTMAILRGQIPGDTVYDPSGNNAKGYVGGNALAKA